MLKKLIIFSITLVAFAAYPQTAKTEENAAKSKCLTELQLEFVNTRYQAYFHFGINTYDDTTTGWGSGKASPKLWNPTGLDCEQWADVIIAAGMKGGWLTTKHHDGFCLWDSKAIDPFRPGQEANYDIAASDNKIDAVKVFTDAFRKKGLKIGLYYSIWDFHYDIRSGMMTPAKEQYMLDQIKELLTNYGKIDYINFDGWSTWPTTPTFDDVPYYEIYNTVKELQPNCLIINHQYESNLAHADIPFADAAGRPYPYHPDYMRPTAGSDVIQQDWFWDDDNFFVYRSKDYILKQLDSYNSHNGVYILNIAPDTNGRLPDDAVQRLREVSAVWQKPAPLEAPGEKWGYQYDVDENLAFMKPSAQSSTHGFIRDKRAYPRAEIALDGVTDGDCMMEQTSWTLEEENPWWRVDLGDTYPVNEITIFNRTDAEADQLENYTVSLLDAAGNVVWKSVQEETPNPSVTIPVEAKQGRFVKIQLNKTGKLALAEVIVK